MFDEGEEEDKLFSALDPSSVHGPEIRSRSSSLHLLEGPDLISALHVSDCGRNRSTGRKPTQTQREHGNSNRIEPRTHATVPLKKNTSKKKASQE